MLERERERGKARWWSLQSFRRALPLPRCVCARIWFYNNIYNITQLWEERQKCTLLRNRGRGWSRKRVGKSKVRKEGRQEISLTTDIIFLISNFWCLIKCLPISYMSKQRCGTTWGLRDCWVASQIHRCVLMMASECWWEDKQCSNEKQKEISKEWWTVERS